MTPVRVTLVRVTLVLTWDALRRCFFPLQVVTKQGNAEYHEVDVNRGSNRPILLPVLGFDNATKRNRPMLKVGDVVYGKIIEVFDEDRIVMDCCNTSGGDSAEGYGPLRCSGAATGGNAGTGGMMFTISPAYAKYLLSGDMEVLQVLGSKVPFEIVVGVNGIFWIASQEKEKERAFLETCVVGSAIRKMQLLGGAGVDQRRIVEVLKKEMEER